MAEALLFQGLLNNDDDTIDELYKLNIADFLSQMDKMKSFEVYFIHNNVESVVEHSRKYQRMMTKFRRKNFRKRTSELEANRFTFLNQISFKSIFKTDSISPLNLKNQDEFIYNKGMSTINDVTPSPNKNIRYLHMKSLLRAGTLRTLTIKKKKNRRNPFKICWGCFKKKLKRVHKKLSLKNN